MSKDFPKMSSSEFKDLYNEGKLKDLHISAHQSKGIFGLGKKTYMDFEIGGEKHSVRMKTAASILKKELKNAPDGEKRIIAKIAKEMEGVDMAAERRDKFYKDASQYMEEDVMPEGQTNLEVLGSEASSSIETKKEQPQIQKKEQKSQNPMVKPALNPIPEKKPQTQVKTEPEAWVESGTESEERANKAIVLAKKDEPKIETKQLKEKSKEYTVKDKIRNVIAPFMKKESPQKHIGLLKQTMQTIGPKIPVPKTAAIQKASPKAIKATPLQEASFEKFQNSDQVRAQFEELLPQEENERKSAIEKIKKNLGKIDGKNITLSNLTLKEMGQLSDLMQNGKVDFFNLVIEDGKILKIDGKVVGKTPELNDLQEKVLNLSKEIFTQEMHRKLLPETKEDLEKLIKFLPELMKILPKKSDSGKPRKIAYSNSMAESIKQISYNPLLINNYVFLPHLQNPDLSVMKTKR